MIRIFNHYINANVVVQMIFDFAFVLVAMITFGALYLQSPALITTTATHSLSLATWTFVVGSATGIYQSTSSRSLQQSVTRALVAALLMPPW
jgi:cbb3-type cytochrome oxidase subunit 1